MNNQPQRLRDVIRRESILLEYLVAKYNVMIDQDYPLTQIQEVEDRIQMKATLLKRYVELNKNYKEKYL